MANGSSLPGTHDLWIEIHPEIKNRYLMDQLTNPILYTFKLLSSLRSRYLVCRCAINIAVSATLFDRKIFQECGQKLNRMEVGSRLRFFQHHESTEFCLNKIKFFRLSNGSVKNSQHLRPKNKDARKKSTEHGIVLKENGDFQLLDNSSSCQNALNHIQP